MSIFYKISRKLYNLFLIPTTFRDCFQIYLFLIRQYILKQRNGTFLTKLKNGTHLFVRYSPQFDIGSVLENFSRIVYLPSQIILPENPVILDIGASIGDFSIFCAKEKKAEVYCFEPTKDAFDVLLENIKINGMETRVKPFNVAVIGSTATEENKSQFPLGTITLQDFFDENNLGCCDLLKMDCEGEEYRIFGKLPDEVFVKIKSIALECHIYDTGRQLSKLTSRLEDVGYQVITTPITEHDVCYLYAIKQ